MSLLFGNDIIIFVLFGLSVFFVSFRWIGQVLEFIHKKTLKSQKETLNIIENMRIQKDRKMTIISLWILSLCIGALFFLLALPNFIMSLSLGFISFLVTWKGVELVMKSLWGQYKSTVDSQMVEAMVLMANGMKVGLTVSQAMERVTQSLKGPLAGEFTLVLNKLKLGMNLEEAINEMSSKLSLQDMTMFATSVNILKETGGNLAETFDTISDTIRSRQKVQSKIKALTSQGMMQAKMVSVVPFILLFIMYFTNPKSVLLLFTTPLGLLSLFSMVALIFVGGKMMKKVATINV